MTRELHSLIKTRLEAKVSHLAEYKKSLEEQVSAIEADDPQRLIAAINTMDECRAMLEDDERLMELIESQSPGILGEAARQPDLGTLIEAVRLLARENTVSMGKLSHMLQARLSPGGDDLPALLKMQAAGRDVPARREPDRPDSPSP